MALGHKELQDAIMEGLESLIKSLPGFSKLGLPGIIAFGVIVLSFIGLKIWWSLKNKKSIEQRQSDSETSVQEKIDSENPTANDSLKNDQDKIDKI